ncbi:MAG: HDOD domain-containing protein, partial [Gemmatimonadaceae bacterium]
AEKSWSHMIRTAPIARALAPAFQVSPDDAYTVGLLHDAGKMIILDRVGSLRTLLRRELLIPYSSLRAILRMLHEDFGALATLEWGLGAKIAHAIATHHRAPVPHVRNSLSEVLFVAERCDLITQQGKRIDLDALWRDGGLTGSRSALDQLFASPPAGVVLPERGAEQADSSVPLLVTQTRA